MSSQSEPTDSIFELRRYTTHPGRRDDLIALFEDQLIEGQEEGGMRLIGQFRDAGDPEQFVWMRDFADMESRRAALQSFYGGPIWARHRDAANATMIDSSNVLLLRPARPGSGLRVDPARRPARAAAEVDGGVVLAAIRWLEAPAGAADVERLEADVMGPIGAAGAVHLASYVTESSANTFPRLPVREGEHVSLVLASAAAPAAQAVHRAVLELRASPPAGSIEVLELHPARRSLLRHPAPPLAR
ncbi:MAG TPA: NIPSNAP family protein [Kofleriaceae bacterium]|nr:NIPSNAP family protein [Kofleriaceae bacterium]